MTDSVYLAPTDGATLYHTTPDCGHLAHANVVDEADLADYPDRSPCPWCHSPDEPDEPVYVTPEAVTCPCGEGKARRVRTDNEPPAARTPNGSAHHHYRHDGCPVGGTIVVVDGEVHRRMGPLFNRGEYHRDERASEAADLELATDGGGR